MRDFTPGRRSPTAISHTQQENTMNRGASFVGVRSSAILVSVSLCFLLTTCGGGGGGDSQGVIPLKSSVIRTIVPGDSWQYDVSGTADSEFGSIKFTGSASAEILSEFKKSPVTNEDCVDQHTVMNLNLPGTEPLDTHVYFRQDGAGSILEYGEGESTLPDKWVTSPAVGYYLELPSPMAVRLPETTNITYDDGTTATYDYQITGTDNVATGMGTFEAYEIHYYFEYTESSGAGGSTMATMWYVPGLGMIKEDAYVAWWDGPGMSGYVNIHYTATLRSTTVAY